MNGYYGPCFPPLTGNDKPGEWPKDKFISLFGSEKLERMVASGILAAGEARTDDIPAFIWEEYPDNAAWCIQQSEHGNIPYSSREAEKRHGQDF